MPSRFILACSLILTASVNGLTHENSTTGLLCNGYQELCYRSYANITYISAHDSPHVQPGSLAANQNRTVTQQLSDGVRALTGQGHNQNGVIHLCHTSCALLDKGPLTAYLSEIKNWLDENPREVITLLWVNSDDLSPSVWGAAYQSAGLASMSYAPAHSGSVKKSEWPNLGSMIGNGTRVVSYLDNSADWNSIPYLIDEFSSIWETPYDETNVNFPCTVDRISKTVTGSPSTIMLAMNHFLDRTFSILGLNASIPATDELPNTNAASSIIQQAEACLSLQGAWPNFILLDYYNEGSVFEAAAQLNGVSLVEPIYTTPRLQSPSTSSTLNSHASSSFSQLIPRIPSVTCPAPRFELPWKSQYLNSQRLCDFSPVVFFLLQFISTNHM